MHEITPILFALTRLARVKNISGVFILFLLLQVLLLQSIAVCSADQSSPDKNYEPGRGLKMGDSGWTLGGYGTALLDYPKDQASRLDLSHLSLFLWWEGDSKFKFFSELDWQDAVAIESTPITTQNEYLALERLYIDYAYSDTVNFRAGKFLTPIGRWNTIHADPLVWTTSRPLLTQALFPLNATGAMIFGTVDAFGRGIDYSIYASGGGDIQPSPKYHPFENAMGAHVAIPILAEGQLGFSFANFEQNGISNGRKNLLGTDFVWSHNRYELSAEAIYRFSERSSELDKKGLYVQAVVPITERLYGVFRYEPFSSNAYRTDRVWVTGLTMRVNPALVVKAEFVHLHSDGYYLHEGFQSSISVLF